MSLPVSLTPDVQPARAHSQERAPAPAHRLELLDYGRFIAAFGVLVSHYFNSGFVNHKLTGVTRIDSLAPLAEHGRLGVHFFFMISGYVIFFSAMGRSARAFAVSRLIRLFPAYWIAVLFTAAFAHFFGGAHMHVSAGMVLANLTMVPQLFGAPFVDGVYWTLQYELTFYAAVMFALLLNLGRFLPNILLCWPLALLVARVTGLARLPLLEPNYAFFALGSIFAIMRGRRTLATSLALLAAIGLCLDNLTGALRTLVRHAPLESSALQGAVAVLLFCVAFSVVNSRWSARLQLPGSEAFGRLTYPLYLVHAHWGFMMLSLTFKWLGFLAYPLVIGGALVIAWLINSLVERRYRKVWFSLFDSSAGLLISRASAVFGAKLVK